MDYREIFQKECKENNIKCEFSFKSNVGRADFHERKILVSEPKTRDRIFVGFHEIGHILNGRVEPRCYEEYLAEKKAIELMRKYNIPLSKKARERSKRHIAIGIQKALHRKGKIKNIPKECRNYIKKDYPKTYKGEKRWL